MTSSALKTAAYFLNIPDFLIQDHQRVTVDMRIPIVTPISNNWLPFYRPYSFASQPFGCFARMQFRQRGETQKKTASAPVGR